MKQVEVIRLLIDNFGSVAAPLSFDLEACGVGLHAVIGRNDVQPQLGSNNVGKSTLWRALSWGLYSKCVDGLRTPDIKPWTGKGSTKVSVVVRVDGGTYVITRQTDLNKLFIDNEVVSQEQVEELIGISNELHKHTLLLGQGRPLFFDLSAADKMKLFVDVLNLDRWDARAAAVVKKVGALHREASGWDTRVTSITTETEVLNEQVAYLQERVESWAADLEQELTQITRDLDTAQKTLEAAKARAGDADFKRDGALTELRPLQVELAMMAGKLRDADRIIIEYEANAKVAVQQLAKAEAELAALDKAKVCPTCKQPIKVSNIAAHRKELEGRVAELKKAQPGKVPAEARKLRDTHNAKVETLEKAAREFQRKADAAQDEINSLNREVGEASHVVRSLEAQKKAKEEARNPYRDQLTKARKRLGELDKELREANKQVKAYARTIERTKFWSDGFRDVRLYMVEEVLQELELTTNNTLAEVGLEDWAVRYAVERETKSGTIERGLNMTVLSPYNSSAVKWESWSGGVGQRLRIVGALALADVLLSHAGVRTNMEILDEPTRGLSAEGIRDLCAMLYRRAHALDRQTFYVDHHSLGSARFDTVTTLVKGAKGTVLV